MAKGKARHPRKPSHQLPGMHREPIRKHVPGAEFQVELTAERREEIGQLLLLFVDSIPANEREFIVKRLSPGLIRDMFGRSRTNLDPARITIDLKVSEIWKATSKYDLYLIEQLIHPLGKVLEQKFEEQKVSNPSEQDFKEIAEFLGKMWSRAAVYAIMAHLALSPLPAQAFALTYIEEIESRRQSEPDFSKVLGDVEFPTPDLITDSENFGSIPDHSPVADDHDLRADESNDDETAQNVEIPSEQAQTVDTSLVQAGSSENSQTPTEIVESEKNNEAEIALENADAPGEYIPVQPTVEIANIDEQIFTPLGRMLITQAVASADGNQIGALNREEYAEMLTELCTLNNAHMPTWFQIGFSSALGLVESDFKMDSAALNTTRKSWHLWGLIKGLVRTDRQAELEQVCDERWEDVLEMFNSGLASEMLVDVAKVVVYQNLERAEKLLGNYTQIFTANVDQEIALIKMLDSESVVMLRNSEADRAIRVLEIAQNRLVYLNTSDRLLGVEKSQITDLYFRIAMGIAACYRATNDFESAIKTLELPDDFPTDQLLSRTAARLYIQQFLSASKAKRIEDIELPRNKSDRKAFKKHYGRHTEYLDKALKINDTNADANYLLAGIMLSEENFEGAATLLGRAILHYGNREDRAVIKPKIKMMQSLLKSRNGDLIDLDQAIDEIIELSPRLQREEVASIIDKAIDLQSSKIAAFIAWAVQGNLDSTLSMSASDISKALKLAPEAFAELLAIASHLPKVAEQITSLIELLENALARQKADDIELVLTGIDELRKGHSPVVHRLWADFCRKNEDFRDYITPFEANLSALASLSEVGDKESLVASLLEILDSMLNIENFEEEGNFQQLLQQLQEIAPELSEIYSDDPRTKAPLEYAGWTQSPAARDASSTTPIRVFFVGGNPERQATINEDIKTLVHERIGSHVEVEFFENTWSSNWHKVLERIEPKLDRVDVVVLSPLVRTTFGQTLRRKLNDLHIPRISCTSEGKSSTLRSIEQAVTVAEKLRTKS